MASDIDAAVYIAETGTSSTSGALPKRRRNAGRDKIANLVFEVCWVCYKTTDTDQRWRRTPHLDSPRTEHGPQTRTIDVGGHTDAHTHSRLSLPLSISFSISSFFHSISLSLSFSPISFFFFVFLFLIFLFLPLSLLFLFSRSLSLGSHSLSRSLLLLFFSLALSLINTRGICRSAFLSLAFVHFDFIFFFAVLHLFLRLHLV